MLKLRIVEGHLKYRIASVRKDGIRYKGQTYQPRALRPLDQGVSDGGAALAGAAGGAIAFGITGAIAGAMVAGGRRTAFVIETDLGRDLVGTVRSDEYVELHVEVERLKGAGFGPAAALGRPGLGWRLFTGPFYFKRYGLGWLSLALVLTLFTYGLAWLVLPFVAGVIDKRKAAIKPVALCTP